MLTAGTLGRQLSQTVTDAAFRLAFALFDQTHEPPADDEHADDQRADPTALLTRRDLFGDLVETPRFTREYAEALRSLQERGTTATLKDRFVTQG